MRRLFRFFFQLVLAAVVVFLMTAALVVFDGLNDQGDKAEAALVTGHAHPAEGKTDPLLDRVVELHREGKVSTVLVIGTAWRAMGDEDSGMMVRYLITHGVPRGDIVDSNLGDSTEETGRIAAEMMKERQIESVMIVADYYNISRLKLALVHEGVTNIGKVHVGTVKKEDAAKIGQAVVTLYGYVGKVYLMPAAEKVKQEAKVGMDKATADAEHAKEKVGKSIDSLAK